LLCLDALENATEKIGLNIIGPYTYKDFTILQGNANNMDCFVDNTFDAVLCNAVLEHDKFFWKTVSEIYRVTKKGGVIVIGTPGYTRYHSEKKVKKFLNKIQKACQRSPFGAKMWNSHIFFSLIMLI